MAFSIITLNRWNERIVQTSEDLTGSGAISEIININLAPNKLLLSDPSGKIIVSSLVTADEANTLTGIDTGTTIQAQLDGKQDTLTLGNLTEATSSILTITGGTAAIIGSGLSIQVKLAGAAQSGYLSTTDWNTFNNKLTSTLTSARIFVGNGSNVATGVAVSGDITMSNAGVVAIAAGVIVDADVNASAAITRTKLAVGNAYRILANSVTGAISENAALTASRAIASDANGQLVASATTATQLSYISTATSDLQVQINTLIAGKATNALIQTPTAAEDGYAITWSDASQEYQLTDPVVQGIPVGGSTSQVLMKDSGVDYDASWTSFTVSHISDITASAADIEVLLGADGNGVTPTILSYLGGANPVSSSIQDQFDAKQSSSLAHNAMWVGNASAIAAQLSPGTDGYVLTSVSGSPQWQPNAASSLNPWLLASGGTFTGNNVITMGTYSLTLTQGVSTSGSPTGWIFNGGAHTTLTATVEATDINFNLARTVQFGTGAIATQRAIRIQAPTYGFVAGSTITNAATLAISGAPAAGTNATITNAYALWVQAGRVRIDGATSATKAALIVQDTTSSGGLLLDLQKTVSAFNVTQEGKVTSAGTIGATTGVGMYQIGNSISSTSNVSDYVAAIHIHGGTITAGVGSDATNTLYGIKFTDTFDGDATNAVVKGFHYDPTLTDVSGTHYATYWNSGLHFIKNHGTSVPAVPTDGFIHYSADIVAGNAAPHFKTEVGDIVKLYKYVNAAFGNVINTGDANTDAAVNALIAALTAHGLIATS